MNKNTLNKTFDPHTLADDLLEVRRVYAQFLAELNEGNWDKPVKGGPKEWTQHEAIAHLVALNGDGLEGIRHALRGEPYTFIGLDTRYDLNDFNRKGIDDHLDIPMKELSARLLDIIDEAAGIARDLQPEQYERTVEMPFYNRPVRIAEALSIFIIHAGLFHTAQVAEPAGLPPLWMQLSPDIRHRMIGRTMLAFSLLYRIDIGGSLRDTIAFRVGGPGGGEWFVDLAPESPASGEGEVKHPGLAIRMHDTDVFCQFITGRLNFPLALIRGTVKLSGDLRLFLRMNTLFSVDARPKGARKNNKSTLKPDWRTQWKSHVTGD